MAADRPGARPVRRGGRRHGADPRRADRQSRRAGRGAAYQIQGVVQAATSGDRERALSAALVLAITSGLSALSYLIYSQMLPRVIEAITVHLDSELVRLTARIPTLEYADRPVHAD